LLGILGLAINWFGDSLDGRIAYFRNISRKWYGFSLDIIMDWVSTVLIGLGYMVYARNEYELIAFVFVVLYGWAMIISQLRYKITDIYSIDSGIVGPTEIRIILALILIAEVLFGHLIEYFAAAICINTRDCIVGRSITPWCSDTNSSGSHSGCRLASVVRVRLKKAIGVERLCGWSQHMTRRVK
jgi:phosphatidylglycerophosphate synthase